MSPLVTIAIATYNSSQTITALLDSIKLQTYQNIEVIISDDHSSDNTIEVCENWKKNQPTNKVEIIESSVNTGVPANFNRAISKARGKYVKIIAGDDMLLPNCIEDNVIFMEGHPEASVVFSQCQFFEEKEGDIRKYEVYPKPSDEYKLLQPTEQQKMYIYHTFFLPTASTFIKKELFNTYRFLEKYRCAEDFPFFTILLQNGIHMYYFKKITVLYRRGPSISQVYGKLVNENLFETNLSFFNDVLADELKIAYPELYKYRRAHFFIDEFKMIILNNKLNYFSRVIIKLLNIKMRKLLSYKIGN